MSGGQQQRVALARAIVTEPKVLLLDEPLSAIDAKLRKALQKRIREIHKELGLTTIFVTHDQDEAMVMSDVIQLFHNGKIEQSGSPVSIYTAPSTSFAASFIGSYNQIPGDIFQKLSGMEIKADTTVAIRPETITISRQEKVNEGCLILQGKIIDSLPRGNVLRYSVMVNNTVFRVDALFRSFQMFQNEENIYLSIPCKDCLLLRNEKSA